MWKVWAQPFDTGELANTSWRQAFRMNSDTIVRAVRTWFVVYNDPTFTSLNAKIYATDAQVEDGTFPATELLHTSDSRTKSEIHTLPYGVKETYFDFSPTAPLQSDTWYALVINAVGYAPTTSSYLAWKHSYPDPVLTGYTPARETINQSPFQIYFIGAPY